MKQQDVIAAGGSLANLFEEGASYTCRRPAPSLRGLRTTVPAADIESSAGKRSGLMPGPTCLTADPTPGLANSNLPARLD